ncbi:MAG TPA: pseudouridine synthase [Spirochaetota bacterium]|nr:rRNA pseudouridine synthase [Spirochaetota bacterium]HQO38926.1 pseudouridine synthase [Spirochaetota bacterium]
MKTRLNKFLASCGLGSRRKVETLITEGRIKVDGRVVKDLATSVDPELNEIIFDGKRLTAVSTSYYLMLNKPKGYITTMSDEKGRATVMSLLPEKFIRAGVVPVGRLDKDTEGLLLFTNDGNLSHLLTSPDFKVKKEYLVELDKPAVEDDLKRIEKGFFVHQIKTRTRPATVSVADKSRMFVKVLISEGKKRQIRYSFKNLGYNVLKLKRTGYGPLSLGRLNKGDHRLLKTSEVRLLINSTKHPE